MATAHSAFVTIFFLICLFVSPSISNSDELILYDPLVYWEGKPLTSENVATAIIEFDIQYPELVFKQAVLESGNFTSRLCIKSNNLFGMRQPRTRKTHAIGRTNSSYAVFKHWSHSIADYKLWQGTKKISNYQQFLTSRKYSANLHYVQTLNKIKIEPLISEILTGNTDRR
jgi:uncharacterized FlgJ-related protein